MVLKWKNIITCSNGYSQYYFILKFLEHLFTTNYKLIISRTKPPNLPFRENLQSFSEPFLGSGLLCIQWRSLNLLAYSVYMYVKEDIGIMKRAVHKYLFINIKDNIYIRRCSELFLKTRFLQRKERGF